MRKDWKKEAMFDMRALGSEFFFFLVFIRSLVGPYFPFAYQLVISGLVIYLISLFYKDFDGYVARGLVLAIFVSIFYDSLLFYVFALILFILILVVCRKLVKKKEQIFTGMVVGIICVLIGYVGGNLLNNLINFS